MSQNWKGGIPPDFIQFSKQNKDEKNSTFCLKTSSGGDTYISCLMHCLFCTVLLSLFQNLTDSIQPQLFLVISFLSTHFNFLRIVFVLQCDFCSFSLIRETRVPQPFRLCVPAWGEGQEEDGSMQWQGNVCTTPFAQAAYTCAHLCKQCAHTLARCSCK